MANTKTLVGFIAGATIGIIAFLMFTPKSKAKEANDTVNNAIDDFTDDFANSVSKAKSEVKNLAD